MKVVIVGAGRHSRKNHLPALARLAVEQPATVVLAAVCDLREEIAREAAAEFGFQRAYGDIDAMFATENPDACVAVTPVDATASIVERLIGKEVPLLIEKPLGSNVGEGRRIVECSEASAAPVMVSLNRRFDPALCSARDWIGERTADALRARVVRSGRRERRFFKDTGIHAVDTLRFLGGDISGFRVIDRGPPGACSVAIGMQFESGARGLLEVYRDSGHDAESYDVFGPGFHAAIHIGERDDGGAFGWMGGQRAFEFHTPGNEPAYFQNGAYHETRAFIENLVKGAPLEPTPRDALASMKICHQIDAALWEEREKVKEESERREGTGTARSW